MWLLRLVETNNCNRTIPQHDPRAYDHDGLFVLVLYDHEQSSLDSSMHNVCHELLNQFTILYLYNLAIYIYI